MLSLYLRRCRPSSDTSTATIEADATRCAVHDDRAVNVGVVKDGAVYIDHGGVIAEISAGPAPANEADAAVSKAVVDAAVEANGWSPIAFVK